MSRVTNAIVTAHVAAHGEADPEIDSVNGFLRESEGGVATQNLHSIVVSSMCLVCGGW